MMTRILGTATLAAALGASSGAVLEFIAPEEGDFLLVDHEFADAQKGAIGHIRVRSRTGRDTHTIEPMKH
jgi:hypothetical protein